MTKCERALVRISANLSRVLARLLIVKKEVCI
jgi:hypothetical protein